MISLYSDSIQFYIAIVVRLLIACILGGIIGYERENMHRPAGFRTHILVCVGSALVMVTSEFIFKRYSSQVNMDPARLGAQVISGIGFLGAGTIIREGFNVKGLTTAASLWAVSCVGIAAGIGFYEGAIVATVLIYLTLIVLKRMERYLSKRNRYRVIYVHSGDINGQIGHVSNVLEKNNIIIKKIEFINSESDKGHLVMKFLIKIPYDLKIGDIINSLHKIEGVLKVIEE
ncbi:MAG: MgtC/SapB family protein [Clostridia bacterium]|nr:MgtC/SapB family protein [Clostridia bacterium]